MEIQYDADSDMLYIGLFKRPSVESEEVAPGVVLDYDAENRVVGIEITDGSLIIQRTFAVVKSECSDCNALLATLTQSILVTINIA